MYLNITLWTDKNASTVTVIFIVILIIIYIVTLITRRMKRNEATTTVTFSSGVVMLNLSESPLNGWKQSSITTCTRTGMQQCKVTLRKVNKNSIIRSTK